MLLWGHCVVIVTIASLISSFNNYKTKYRDDRNLRHGKSEILAGGLLIQVGKGNYTIMQFLFQVENISVMTVT